MPLPQADRDSKFFSFYSCFALPFYMSHRVNLNSATACSYEVDDSLGSFRITRFSRSERPAQTYSGTGFGSRLSRCIQPRRQANTATGRGGSVWLGVPRCRQRGSRIRTSPAFISSGSSGMSPSSIRRNASAFGNRCVPRATSNGPCAGVTSMNGKFTARIAGGCWKSGFSWKSGPTSP